MRSEVLQGRSLTGALERGRRERLLRDEGARLHREAARRGMELLERDAASVPEARDDTDVLGAGSPSDRN